MTVKTTDKVEFIGPAELLTAEPEVRPSPPASLDLQVMPTALHFRRSHSHRHPRWVGMRLRKRELALWSFLMSSAHGAGLMLIPVVMGIRVNASGGMLMPSSLGLVAGAVLIHTAAMVAVAGVIAIAVYEFLGVGFLRRGWLNLDRVWPYALGAGAAATLLIA